MSFADGMPFLVILLGPVAFVIGAVLLGIVYGILSRVKARAIRAVVLALVPALGFLLSMGMDTLMVLIGAIASVVPATVLVPPFLVMGPAGRMPAIRRIIACDILVSVFAAFQPFLLVWSGLSMAPGISGHTPVTNGAVYAGAIVADTCIAVIVYKLTSRGPVTG